MNIAAVVGIAIGGYLAFLEVAIPATLIVNEIRFGERESFLGYLYLLAPIATWITVIVVGVRRARVRRSWQYGVRWFGVATPVTAVALVIFIVPAFIT